MARMPLCCDAECASYFSIAIVGTTLWLRMVESLLRVLLDAGAATHLLSNATSTWWAEALRDD